MALDTRVRNKAATCLCTDPLFFRSDCHYFSSTPQKYLFSSPNEICHWNSAVWDSLSPPESVNDFELSSQAIGSSPGVTEPSIIPNMEYRTSHPEQSYQWSARSQPERSPDQSHTGLWADSQVPRTTSFSPVFSDLTLPFSEDSFAYPEPVTSQDFPATDPFAEAHWSSALTDHSYINESAVSHSSTFAPNNDAQPEVMQAGYNPCFTSSEINFDQYLHLDQIQGPPSEVNVAASQTVGFLSQVPAFSSLDTGRIYPMPGYDTGYTESAGVPNGYYNGPSVPFSESLHQPDLEDSKPFLGHPVTARSPLTQAPESADKHAQIIQGRAQNSAGHRIPGSQAVSYMPVRPSATISASHIKRHGSPRSGSPNSDGDKGLEDDDSRPRSHRFYTTAKLDGSGHYHCPYLGTENCAHKPTKLKCNYDKYIDSHLKPFVCKQSSCKGADNENRFSSTACLLRHEREAHGLHGHGNKPYLCKYDGCERAISGNGFPRNYNLMDHMKRVHRYKPEEKTTNTAGFGQGRRNSKASTDRVQKRKSAASRNPPSRGVAATSRRYVASPAAIPEGQRWVETNMYGDELQQQTRPMHDIEPGQRGGYRTGPFGYS